MGGIFKSGGGKKSNFGKVGGAEKEDRKKETKILPHTLTYSNPGYKDPFCAAYQAFCSELGQIIDCTMRIIQDGDAVEDRKEGTR